LKRGSSFTKGTLGASFKIERVKGTTKKKDIAFGVSRQVFRKPKKAGKEQVGSKIFVQRGGAEVSFVKGARLASYGERKEFKRLREKQLFGRGKTPKQLGRFGLK